MPSEREAIIAFLRSRSPLAEWVKRGVAFGTIKTFPDEVPGDDTIAVLAGPTTNIVGSKQVECLCGAKVWISPSTQAMMSRNAHRKIIFMCRACANTEAEKEGEDGSR